MVPLVPFEACLSKLAAAETLDSFRGHAAASKTVRFKTFPRYLVVHMQRYVQKPDWTIGKLNVEVPVPETLDLSALRATGLQPGETAMAEDAVAPAAGAPAAAAAAAPAAAATEPDEGILAQLISMGFSENGSKRAAIAVKNVSGEAAMEWVFAHMWRTPTSTTRCRLRAHRSRLPAAVAAAAAAAASRRRRTRRALRCSRRWGSRLRRRAARWRRRRATWSAPPTG